MFALILFAAGWASARRQSAAAGALEGSVTDTAGQRVADVTVELLSAATNERHVAKADAIGAFHFSLIPSGTYQVELCQGFRTARMAQLTLNASEVPVLEAVLEPGDSDVTVECACHLRAVAPLTGTLVDQKTITAVPLNTRNFTQVLSMSSGSVATLRRPRLLHAAGAQEENSLGASGGRPGDLACRLRTDAQRIAYRQVARRPAPRRRLRENCRSPAACVSPSAPTCRGLRIAPPVPDLPTRGGGGWLGTAKEPPPLVFNPRPRNSSWSPAARRRRMRPDRSWPIAIALPRWASAANILGLAYPLRMPPPSFPSSNRVR